MPALTIRICLSALVLIAVLAFIACSNADDTPAGLNASGGDDSVDAEYRDESLLAPADGDSVSLEPGAAGESNLPATLDRKIIRTASLSLAVEDILAGARQIEDTATAAGGFVASSNVTTESGDSGPQAAAISIRVPAESYTATLNQLRGIAESVQAESSETTEVTEEYTDLQSRLRNLEATEAQYLALLETTQSIDEVLAVQDRLTAVRAEIEQVTGRINSLDTLTELATINVALSLPVGGASGSSQHWATQAWEASWEASKDVAVVLGSGAIGLAVLALWVVPVTIVAFVVWILFGKRIANLATRLTRESTPETPAAS